MGQNAEEFKDGVDDGAADEVNEGGMVENKTEAFEGGESEEENGAEGNENAN